MFTEDLHILLGLLSTLYFIIEIAAILTSISAVRDTRTPQGAVAWFVALIAFPVLSLPLYWIFGRNKFNGYVDAMRAGEERFLEIVGNDHSLPAVKELSERRKPHSPRTTFETLAQMPFMDGNRIDLLVDGEVTFDAIFRAIEGAESYILIQFYIVHDDGLGNRLKDLLIRKAKQGVRINFLFDEIGCHATPTSYWDAMRDAGIDVHSFHTTKGRGNRFQINFRNHRKIVVIDGHTAFVGGHNVGDEYLGKSRRFEGWRDTHLKITGPAVLGVRVSFAKDWYWATGTFYALDLSIPEATGGVKALSLSTGPADDLESCSLMFIRAINASRKRFWIASPYFVPDGSVSKALQLAAMRGVDIRIMLPHKPDHLLVHLASFACLKELNMPNIKVYRYDEGFLHQKVFLADDDYGAVGTANLDNRSFRLNFEITTIIEDRGFCQQLEQMFLNDFEHCVEVGTNEYEQKNTVSQTVIKFTRLLSPIL